MPAPFSRSASGDAATTRLKVKAPAPARESAENDSCKSKKAMTDAHSGVCA